MSANFLVHFPSFIHCLTQKAAIMYFKQNTIIKFVENPNIFHENYTL